MPFKLKTGIYLSENLGLPQTLRSDKEIQCFFVKSRSRKEPLVSPSMDPFFFAQHLLNHCLRSGDWLLVVVPSSGKAGGVLLTHLLNLISPAIPGGRTILLPNGGRITVLSVLDPMKPQPTCRLLFYGFEGSLLPGDEIAVHNWRQRTETVTLDGKGNLLSSSSPQKSASSNIL